MPGRPLPRRRAIAWGVTSLVFVSAESLLQLAVALVARRMWRTQFERFDGAAEPPALPHWVFSSRRRGAPTRTNVWLVRALLAAMGFLVGVGAGLVLLGRVLAVMACFSEWMTDGCVLWFSMLGLVLAAIVFAAQRRGALWADAGLIGLLLGRPGRDVRCAYLFRRLIGGSRAMVSD